MAKNEWGLTIELVPHVGTAETPLGPTEVKLPQWIVMASSRQIEMNYGRKAVECGIAGFETHSVEFHAHTNKWPPQAKAWICEEVGRLSGVPRRGNSPVMPTPPIVEDVDENDIELGDE